MSSSIIDYLDNGKYVNDKNVSIRSLVLKDSSLTVGSALTVDVSGKVVSSSSPSFFSVLQNQPINIPNQNNGGVVFNTVQPDSVGSGTLWAYNVASGVLTVLKGGLFLLNVNILATQNGMDNGGAITIQDTQQSGGAFGAIFPSDFTGITGPLSYSRVLRIADNTNFAVRYSNNKNSGLLIFRSGSWTLTQLSS